VKIPIMVIMGTNRKDEIFHGHLHLDPFFISERRPNKVRFGDSRLVRAKNNFGFLIINVETSQQ